MDTMAQAIEILAGKSATTTPTEATPSAEATPTTPAPAVETSKATTPEPVAPVVEPKKEGPGDFAARFAALARKEKDIAKRDAEIKAKAESLKGRTVEDLRQLAKKEPLKILEEVGLTFDEVAQHILDSGVGTPEKKLSDLELKIKALEDKEKQMAEQEARMREEQAITQFKNGIKEVLVKNTDKYELIQGSQSEGLVYEVIEKYFQDSGEVLDVEAACDEVEKYLESQVERWSAFKKVQTRFAPKPAEQVKEAVKPEPKKETTSTLTNDEASASREVRVAPKNREDEFEEAMKLLRFTKS
jgi:hypothetical protein